MAPVIWWLAIPPDWGQMAILIWAGGWSLLAVPATGGFVLSLLIKYLVYEHGVFARLGLLLFVGTKVTQLINVV